MEIIRLSSITRSITGRPESLFAEDVNQNQEKISDRVGGKSVMVIGGAGSIGSAFIKTLLPFRPAKISVIDIDENGLAELIRDLRSQSSPTSTEIKVWPLTFGCKAFQVLLEKEGPFELVANCTRHNGRHKCYLASSP